MPKKRYNSEEVIHKLRESGVFHVARRIRAKDAIDVFADLMQVYGIPEQICSDKGPEMIAKCIRTWLGRLGTQTLYITPGSP
jgi:putative transposase